MGKGTTRTGSQKLHTKTAVVAPDLIEPVTSEYGVFEFQNKGSIFKSPDHVDAFFRSFVSREIQLSMEVSRLTRDGTVEPVSRDQILRRKRGQDIILFPCSADHDRIGNLTRSIHTLASCVIIHTVLGRLGINRYGCQSSSW